MVRSGLPMQIAFRLSRTAIDRMADSALADPENANQLAGRWAGLYRIGEVEVIGKTVVLYFDAGGEYGFARVPGYLADSIENPEDPKNDPLYYKDFPKMKYAGGPIGHKIADDWFVLFDFYWLVKVGWS